MRASSPTLPFPWAAGADGGCEPRSHSLSPTPGPTLASQGREPHSPEQGTEQVLHKQVRLFCTESALLQRELARAKSVRARCLGRSQPRGTPSMLQCYEAGQKEGKQSSCQGDSSPPSLTGGQIHACTDAQPCVGIKRGSNRPLLYLTSTKGFLNLQTCCNNPSGTVQNKQGVGTPWPLPLSVPKMSP